MAKPYEKDLLLFEKLDEAGIDSAAKRIPHHYEGLDYEVYTDTPGQFDEPNPPKSESSKQDEGSKNEAPKEEATVPKSADEDEKSSTKPRAIRTKVMCLETRAPPPTPTEVIPPNAGELKEPYRRRDSSLPTAVRRPPSKGVPAQRIIRMLKQFFAYRRQHGRGRDTTKLNKEAKNRIVTVCNSRGAMTANQLIQAIAEQEAKMAQAELERRRAMSRVLMAVGSTEARRRRLRRQANVRRDWFDPDRRFCQCSVCFMVIDYKEFLQLIESSGDEFDV